MTDPDAGVRSAAEYARRTIGDHEALARDLEELAQKRAKVGNWRILSNGLCMITVSPPPGSTVDYPFEISSTEVTVKQFQQFRPDQLPSSEVTKFADCPMNMVHLFDSMQFCRWLSEQESDFEASRCVYPPVETIGPWLLLAPDYQKWEGFRLPTEAEWDCAVGAGTITRHFFGDSLQHLSRYAWWVGSSREQLWPVGLKRPNPLGLMDVYGNVAEWCHPTQVFFNPVIHPVRGGGYRTTSRLIDIPGSAAWQSDKPLSTIGFRVVRIPKAAR
jgi:formylglycine-generating enzyme required for sulfatase activity